MDKDYDASLAKCGWDGDPSGWTDFVRRVRLLYEKTPRKKRRQLGSSIVSQLRERAWTITQDVCHQKLTRRDGCVYLLEFLRDRLGRSPIPDIGIRLEELMIRLRRTAGTPMSSWASQVRQTYKRVQVALHRARKEQGTLQPLTTTGSDAAPAKGLRRRLRLPAPRKEADLPRPVVRALPLRRSLRRKRRARTRTFRSTLLCLLMMRIPSTLAWMPSRVGVEGKTRRRMMRMTRAMTVQQCWRTWRYGIVTRKPPGGVAA